MNKRKFNKLLDKLRNHDNSALEPIYNEYHGRITYTALQIVRDYSEATDIASDIFLYLLENADSVDYIEYPDAWMRRLTKNFSIDFVRRDAKLMKTDNFVFKNDSEPNISEKACLCLEIAAAVGRLSEQQQNLFELHYIYGFKYKEIAATLSIPIGTIKRKIQEIKTELKKYL